MALPVSIGDAIMLSKLALRIGQAFTSGLKSAQTEFLEVQTLLSTLSRALGMLAREIPEVSNAQSESHHTSEKDEHENSELSHIVTGCRETLKHLESVVAKYTALEGENLQTREGRVQRWKDEIFKNWKKIIWTTEGGDIGALKVTLTAHITSLNVALSIINK